MSSALTPLMVEYSCRRVVEGERLDNSKVWWRNQNRERRAWGRAISSYSPVSRLIKEYENAEKNWGEIMMYKTRGRWTRIKRHDPGGVRGENAFNR